MAQPLQFVRLRVSGFKSFCDPTEIDIGPGLTGIVGPNGCGKSNVVEALRWVMGESSAKGLRGGEMDDVIFAGSAVRAPYDLAEVALGLKRPPLADEAGVHVLPHSEDLEISRRIGRGTGSLYRLNGREVRARDIQLLFADVGSGAKSPAIVGQGQVGFIVEAKPEERRRLLEEAAGIGGMHSRRREAELKLQATLANLERVTDQLGMLATRRTALEKQAREAERYKKLQGQIRALETLLVAARITAGRGAVAAAGEELAAARAILLEVGDEARAAEAAHDTIARCLPGLRDAAAVAATVSARLAERRDQETEARARKDAELARLAADRDDAAARITALEQAIDAGTARQTTIDSALRELHERQERLAAQAPELTAAAESAAQERQRLGDDERAARETLATAERQLESTRARHDERHIRLRAVQAELARLGEVADDALVEAAERRHLVAEAELARATGDATAAKTTRDAAAAPLDGLRRQLAEAREMAQDARERLAALDAEADRCRTRRAGETERRQWYERALEQAEAEVERVSRAAGEIVHTAPEALAEAEAALATLREHATALTTESESLAAEADAVRALVEERERAVAALSEDRVKLAAEAAALASLAEPVDASPVLDRLVVAPGYETALAAALGDDLLAGTEAEAVAHWGDVASRADDSPLPGDAEPLATRVTGVPRLERRLRQIGVVVDAARATALQASLAPGQRLVTPEGGIWRWDGFVRGVEVDDPIRRRLAQRQRAQALAARLAELDEAVAASTTARDEAGKAYAAVEEKLAACRRERQELDLRIDREAQALDAARERRERQAREAERLAVALARAEGEVAEHRAALEAIAAGLAALDADAAALDLETARQALEDAQARSSELEAAVAAAETTLWQADQRLAEADAAERQAHQEALAARLLLERRQSEAELRKSHRQEATGGLTAEEARLRGELEALDVTIAGIEAETAGARATADALAGRLAATAERAETLRADLAALETERQSVAERRRALEDEARHLTPELERRDTELKTAMARRAQLDATIEVQLAEHSAAAGDALDRELAAAEVTAAEAASRLQAAEAELMRKEAERRRTAAALAAAQQRVALAEAECQRLAAAQAELESEISRRLGQPVGAILSQLEASELGASLAGETPEALQARLDRLKVSRERLGAVNLRAAIECEELAGKITQLEQEEAEIRTAVERLQRAIGTLNREARSRLESVFDDVDRHFRHLFQRLFGGGKAHLRLVNLDDPLNAGLELEAMPPGKKLQNIRLLSGGEKSLTALALVFAFFLTQPSPLCVLDEVDAALDDANVERFADLLEEMAKETNTRFLVVTHHPLTMARMHRLFGVTMAERGVSKLVSVAFEDAERFKESA